MRVLILAMLLGFATSVGAQSSIPVDTVCLKGREKSAPVTRTLPAPPHKVCRTGYAMTVVPKKQVELPARIPASQTSLKVVKPEKQVVQTPQVAPPPVVIHDTVPKYLEPPRQSAPLTVVEVHHGHLLRNTLVGGAVVATLGAVYCELIRKDKCFGNDINIHNCSFSGTTQACNSQSNRWAMPEDGVALRRPRAVSILSFPIGR